MNIFQNIPDELFFVLAWPNCYDDMELHFPFPAEPGQARAYILV